MITPDTQLTKNFKLSEFIESRFYEDNIQQKVIESYDSHSDVQLNILDLAENLQVLRNEVKQPISINIAYRPIFWEKMQGRDGTSQHTKGKAADIKVNNYTPDKVAGIIEKLIDEDKMAQGGLSAYNTFTHYDIRNYFVRW